MTTDSHWVIPEFSVRDRLRKARELTGLDRQDFAAEIDVSRNTVTNYEMGHTTPKRLVLKAWALRTGVPLVWLETGIAPADDGGGDDLRARRDSNSQPSDP